MPHTLPTRPAGPTRELRYRFGENIRLKSPVQGYVYLEQYGEGIRRFEGIVEPSADDERWGGVCYDELNQPATARFLVDQAVSKNNLGAQLELARHWLRLGENVAALEQLGTLEPLLLDPIDRVLWYSARSEALGRLESVESALPNAEKALLEVQNRPEFSVCAPWVYRKLGKLYAAHGDHHSALYYQNWALKVTLNASSALRLERASSLIALGRLEEAEADLTQPLGLPGATAGPLGAYASLELVWGHFYQAQHKLEQAEQHYSEAALQATGDRDTVFEAQLAHAVVLAQPGNPALEGAVDLMLQSARERVETPYQSHLLELREVQIGVRLERLEPGVGALRLLECAAGFERLGRLREHCWALLHAADAQLAQQAQSGAVQADRDEITVMNTLERMGQQVRRVHNPALLWGEWPSVSEPLMKLLERHDPALHLKTPSSVIDLITLGQERIVVGGKIVPVPMRRFVEVLTYIHQHREVSLAQVVRDIFSDEPLQKTRNYFHQLRHQLKLYTPQLEVVYTPERRTYHLESKLPLRWDVDGVRAGRATLNGREFLPGSGSEWVLRLSAELQQREAPLSP